MLKIVEAGLLGLAAWPGVRLLANRLLLRSFAGLYATLLGVLGLWIAGIGVLTVYVPHWLHPLAIVTGVAVAGAAWRARAGYGRSRGLPPGSLSMVTCIEAMVDRRFYLKQAERYGPIFKMAQFHLQVICVVGLERGHKLLRDHAEAIGPCPQPFTHELSGGFLRYMADETYSMYGNLFRTAFSTQMVTASIPLMIETTRRELGNMADDCSKSPDHAVRPSAYFERLIYDAFVRTLFGIVPGTEAYTRMTRLYSDFSTQALSKRLNKKTREAFEKLRQLVLQQTEHLQDLMHNGQAPVCALTELSRLKANGVDLTCVDNLLFILKIASANVVGLLHWLVKTLGEHPAWIGRLRSELEAQGPRSESALADRIIMETLRLAQSEYLYRVVEKDIEYEGFTFPKGWLVRLCIWESHRSAETFQDPEEFNPDRFLHTTFNQSQYSPFGYHQHSCNGVVLTRVVCRVVIEQLVSGFEWQVASDGPLERDFRHWNHWRPNSRLRLRLRQLDAA